MSVDPIEPARPVTCNIPSPALKFAAPALPHSSLESNVAAQSFTLPEQASTDGIAVSKAPSIGTNEY
jgi:hypothetical protein